MEYIGNGWDKSGKNGNFIVVRIDVEALQNAEVDEHGKISLFVFPKGELSHDNVEKEEDWHGDYSVALPEDDGGKEKKSYSKNSDGHKKGGYKKESSGERQKPKTFKNSGKKSAFGKGRK